MDKLEAIEAETMAAEEKLAKAEAAKDRDLTVAYLNNLTEQSVVFWPPSP
jgi:hypothetical protein